MGRLGEQEHQRGKASSGGGVGMDIQEPQLEGDRGQLVMRPSAGTLRMGHGEPGQSQNRLCQDEGGMASQRGSSVMAACPPHGAGRQSAGCLAGLRR